MSIVTHRSPPSVILKRDSIVSAIRHLAISARRSIVNKTWRYAGAAACMALSSALFATPDWIEGIDTLYEKAERSAVQVQLSQPFTVVAMEKASGKQCSVRLQPGFAIEPHQGRFGKETLPWQATEALPLTRVQSEWIAEQLWVHLNFRRNVACTVQLSADQRSLWVTLSAHDPQTTQKNEKALEAGKQALAQGHTQQAIQLLQTLASSGKGADNASALEYLGVAYERAQRYNDAISTYQRYLKQYSPSPSSQRVEQRLQGLTLMQQASSPTLRAVKPARRDDTMRWFGVIGNGYQYFSSSIGDEPSRVYQSTWMTDVNLNGRYRGERYDTKIQLSGGYWHDFEDNLDEPTRLSRAYADVFDKTTRQQIKFGRQTTQGEGVLGRFDGARYSKSLNDEWRINALAGYPVLTSRQVTVDSERQLAGASLDFEPGNSAWKSNVFLTQQTYNGMTDRQATGTEITYVKPTHSYLGYLDYDVFFNELNTLLINANWYGRQETHYYLSADYRRSPVLTLNNALIGQGLEDLNALIDQGGFTEQTLEEVALDRTAVSTTLAGGMNRRWSKHFRWGVDLSGWQLSDTDTSAGVQGFEGTDVETNLSLQLIGNDLWFKRDMSWLTVRYADLTNSQLFSLTAETRLPLGTAGNEHWRIRPRVRFYQRDYAVTDGQQTSVQPLLKLEYIGSPQWAWEMDVGTEWLSTEHIGIEIDRKDYFIYSRLDWLF